MPDDNKKIEIDTLVDPSVNEKTENENKNGSTGGNAEREGLLKEIKAERDKRHELESKMSELESRLNSRSTEPSTTDSELELAVERLAPILQKKGFITSQQKEDEDRAQKYATDLENLSKKYDGNDGRPAFDPTEVATHAKRQGIFNLEAAYRDLHWKELIDFEKKQSGDESVETDRPNSATPTTDGKVKLSQDFLKERLAKPDGKEWYEKNREKIMAAVAKGLL